MIHYAEEGFGLIMDEDGSVHIWDATAKTTPVTIPNGIRLAQALMGMNNQRMLKGFGESGGTSMMMEGF